MNKVDSKESSPLIMYPDINILRIVHAGVYLSIVFWIYFGREDSTQRSR